MPQAVFANVAKDLGLVHTYFNAKQPKTRLLQIYEQLGGGIATLDFDLDGNVDVYCAQAAGSPPGKDGDQPNRLFRQTDESFVDQTLFAGAADRGYTLGITTGDLNQDGFADLVVGNLGVNTVLVNQGDGTFRSMAMPESWDENRFTTGVAIADVTGDRIPDLIEINYLDDPDIYRDIEVGPNGIALRYPGPVAFRAATDRVWIQRDNGELLEHVLGEESQNASAEIGDSANPSLGLLVTDLDHQPGLEIFVANDVRPNQLWSVIAGESDLDKVAFQDRAVVAGCAFSSRGQANACMGVAHADFDGSGRSDLIVTNWIDEWVNFFRQTSLDGSSGESALASFRDEAPRWGLDEPSEGILGFGAQAIDFDNNSLIDLVITNGHIDDFTHLKQSHDMPGQLFANLGERFELLEPIGDYWTQLHLGRSLVTLDHNRDGRVDFAVTDLREPIALLENQTETDHHWLQLRMVGTSSERDAIGAHVRVTAGDRSFHATVATGDGYQGKNEAILSFGLANFNSPVGVEVHWPSGSVSIYEAVGVDRRYLLVEGEFGVWLDIKMSDTKRQ